MLSLFPPPPLSPLISFFFPPSQRAPLSGHRLPRGAQGCAAAQGCAGWAPASGSRAGTRRCARAAFLPFFPIQRGPGGAAGMLEGKRGTARLCAAAAGHGKAAPGPPPRVFLRGLRCHRSCGETRARPGAFRAPSERPTAAPRVQWSLEGTGPGGTRGGIPCTDHKGATASPSSGDTERLIPSGCAGRKSCAVIFRAETVIFFFLFLPQAGSWRSGGRQQRDLRFAFFPPRCCRGGNICWEQEPGARADAQM